MRKKSNNNGTTYPNGATVHFSLFPFASIRAVSNCPCEDGKARNVTVTGEADSFFSQPARTTVAGKTITGYITFDDRGPEFRANAFGKNAGAMKRIKR